MATIERGPVQAAYTISGNSPWTMYHAEGTRTWTGNYIAGYGGGGQTSTGYFMKGALLYVNGTGGLDVVRKAHATSATGADASLLRILGFAMANGTGTTTNEVPILMACRDTVFVGNIGSRTSAATATPSLATHYAGVAAGASMNASRCYPMTVGSSAGSSIFYILGKYKADNWGDSYGRVLFVFQPQACLLR